jgi:hypothetical protein
MDWGFSLNDALVCVSNDLPNECFFLVIVEKIIEKILRESLKRAQHNKTETGLLEATTPS